MASIIQAAIVDNREPEWVKQLSFGGCPVIVQELEAGDVHIVCNDGALLVIERKTPDDLLQSIKDGRALTQLSRLKKVSQWAYVMITGQLTRDNNGNVVTDLRETKWNWNAVQGVLLSMQECGVFVTQCAGDFDFEAAVQRLAARSRKDVFLVPTARVPKVAGPAVMFLAALPNIGLEKAEILLQQSGMRPAIALRNLLDLEAVTPGIGGTTKRLARAALGIDEDMDLKIVWNEKVMEEAEHVEPEQVAAIA